MILCVIGTRAQLIKMAPVLRALEARDMPYSLVFTGQHKVTMNELLREFQIRTPPQIIYDGPEVTGIVQMGGWFVKTIGRLLKSTKPLPKAQRAGSIVLVHGDTFSTLLGAVLGTIRGIKVGHVESGLRSFNWFHPFPEELTRLAVFRLTDIAFCPNDWAAHNLRRYRMEKIDCGQNTLLDCVRYALEQAQEQAPEHAPAAGQNSTGSYGVVSLHRFENIFNQQRLVQILELLGILAAANRLVFVLHPATEKKLTAFGLLEGLRADPRFDLRARMGYLEFLRLINGARFVVTDGGSNQEELSYLGIPTLLMRKATERNEGLDTNVTIANYQREAVEKFAAILPAAQPVTNVPAVHLPEGRPSEIIADRLRVFADR